MTPAAYGCAAGLWHLKRYSANWARYKTDLANSGVQEQTKLHRCYTNRLIFKWKTTGIHSFCVWKGEAGTDIHNNNEKMCTYGYYLLWDTQTDQIRRDFQFKWSDACVSAQEKTKQIHKRTRCRCRYDLKTIADTPKCPSQSEIIAEKALPGVWNK